MIRSVAVLTLLLGCPILLQAQEINFDDLRRPGKPLAKNYTTKGAGIDGASAISKYIDVDMQRVSRSKEVRAAAAATYCGSSDKCFEVVSSSAGKAIIKCIKGTEYAMSRTFEICGPNGKGKWASGCGLTDTFAYHYTFEKAANIACQ